ncbi:hypothetical protein SI65_08333 [Aspergillus cristatus]|uniref:Uncharacterized protein n=1 Tax=Aspergillus cristatus TaxID=573508 RepID=A0A1E3B5V2_ASPCR|nr:hypothetical protein SI65_08333 [Aspergillus cristatus]
MEFLTHFLALSDFYLFDHLLSENGSAQADQFWLTSENPKDLVRKYKQYTHWEHQGHGRIVLDEAMLPMENLRLVPRKDLHKSFLNTIREQTQIAQRDGQELLLLIFGNRDIDTSGVTVGYDTVFMRNIITLLPSDLSVILLMTYCYSRGWLVRPDLIGLCSDGSAKDKGMGRLSASLAASVIFEPSIAVEGGFKELTKYKGNMLSLRLSKSCIAEISSKCTSEHKMMIGKKITRPVSDSHLKHTKPDGILLTKPQSQSLLTKALN